MIVHTHAISRFRPPLSSQRAKHAAQVRNTSQATLLLGVLATFVTMTCHQEAVGAGRELLPGEIPYAEVQAECPRFLQLLSGKLFRVKSNHAETSTDEGKTWQRGGRINPFNLGWKLNDVAIQIQSGEHEGRIVVPFYLGMYGDHPDYTTAQRGGYAIYKGEKILLETHTHIPEMSGSFVCYSDDEGKTWDGCVNDSARGFMMGYFKDGHMGHLTCEEPVVAELTDGRLLCYMRSTCGRILKSYSADGGRYWSKVEATDLAMSNSPCALARIPATGHLVLVWNQVSAAEIRRGYRRGRLSIAISKDDTENWINIKTLELSPGLEPATHVEPPPLTAMVRGGSGPDEVLSVIPEGFTHFHYPNIYCSQDKIFISYAVSPIEAKATRRWRAFPITWLYEPEGSRGK